MEKKNVGINKRVCIFFWYKCEINVPKDYNLATRGPV